MHGIKRLLKKEEENQSLSFSSSSSGYSSRAKGLEGRPLEGLEGGAPASSNSTSDSRYSPISMSSSSPCPSEDMVCCSWRMTSSSWDSSRPSRSEDLPSTALTASRRAAVKLSAEGSKEMVWTPMVSPACACGGASYSDSSSSRPHSPASARMVCCSRRSQASASVAKSSGCTARLWQRLLHTTTLVSPMMASSTGTGEGHASSGSISSAHSCSPSGSASDSILEEMCMICCKLADRSSSSQLACPSVASSCSCPVALLAILACSIIRSKQSRASKQPAIPDTSSNMGKANTTARDQSFIFKKESKPQETPA